MDKSTEKSMNKNGKKGMSRTEFAQEYSIDTGKVGKEAGKSSNQKNTGKCK